MAIPKIYNPNPGSLSGLPPIVLGVLAGMDKQGETILGTWLYGGGVDHDVEDPSWTAYMMEHKSLRLQILARLMPAVKKIADLKKLGRFPIAERFHAEFPENSGFSGYALLHGSNKDVGDFLLAGFAEVQEAVDPAEGDYDIELELRFVFNDIVDPNGKYVMDRIRSIVAHFFTVLQPRNYRLSINWSSSCLAEVRKDKEIFFSGYPSEHPRGVRPLPRAKLDWVGAEKKGAKEIEVKIIAQLQRRIPSEDVASLADRKRRLLWLFYRLSGYMGSTYLDRISNPARNDELPRLLHDRISSELRAEIMEALRGKRPQGVEPL
jgi:hypothetical protein